MPCQSATTAGPNHPYAPAGDHSECIHQRFLPAALRCIFTRCMSPRVHEPLPKATEDPTANRGTSLGNRQKSDQQASWASAACGKCPVSSVRSDPVLVVSCVASGRVRSRFAGSVGYRPPVPRSEGLGDLKPAGLETEICREIFRSRSSQSLREEISMTVVWRRRVPRGSCPCPGVEMRGSPPLAPPLYVCGEIYLTLPYLVPWGLVVLAREDPCGPEVTAAAAAEHLHPRSLPPLCPRGSHRAGCTRAHPRDLYRHRTCRTVQM